MRVPGRYRLKRCRDCGAVLQDPRVVAEERPLLYPEDYHGPPRPPPQGRAPRSDPRGRLREATRAAAVGRPLDGGWGLAGRALASCARGRERAFWPLRDALIPRRAPPGRALDIGCGDGGLLAALADAGWAAEGVEWLPGAAEAARRRSGCFVHTGDFRRLDLPAGSYDLIAMSHVLEHLDHPGSALQAIGHLLAPGGRAVITCPNPCSLGARWFGANWLHWDQPRHLVLLPPRTLRRLAADASAGSRRVRTRAADAARSFALSRLKRRCATTGEVAPRERGMEAEAVRAGDRALALLERLLVGLGLALGEELELCLWRQNGP